MQHRKESPNRPSLVELYSKVPLSGLAVAFRHIEPTWRNYIEFVNYAAVAGDDDMRKYLATFQSLPKSEQRTVLPEQVCDMCGIQTGALIAAVSRYYWEQRQGESTITAAAQHPKMVQATAYWGQQLAECNRDRELFFRLTGGLPDKKGTSIVIHNNPQTANISASPAGASGFRPMDQRVIEMGKLLDEPADSISVPNIDKDSALVFAEDSTEED